MIIAISGRKQSGKSLLAETLINRGFKRFSFATFLKESLSRVMGLPLVDFYDEKAKERKFVENFLWSKDHTDSLSELCAEEIPHYRDEQIYSIRRAMEYVGTDVLRKFDTDFHVKKTVNIMREHGGDCVIDDMRFPNELAHMRASGERCIFVIRPFHSEYSNNPVESSVNWDMPYDHILVNAGTKDDVIKSLDELLAGKKIAGTSYPVDRSFMSLTSENSYNAGCTRGSKLCQLGFLKAVINPFVIENLKMWNAIGDVESMGIPYQIADNAACATAYWQGVLDGKKMSLIY